MSLTALTVDELYHEIAGIAREQGASNQAMWDEIVEELLEDHLAVGEIDLDEDTEAIKEALRSRWSEYKIEAAADDGELFDGDQPEGKNKLPNEEEEES